MSKRVFVTGGTGFIGRALVAALRARGDEVFVLTRDARRARGTFDDPSVALVEGDPNLAGAWQARLAEVDAVVHLAGESVAARRWNARFKQIIRDSRVESTRHVVEGLAALDDATRPRVLVNASGVDYYAPADEFSDEDEVTEEAPAGDRFLARVCVSWEREARAAEDHGVRVVCMRTGVVLGEGGPLEKMSAPFKVFAGGHVGSGRQWVSWIHREDAVRAYLFALDQDELVGPVNLVGPEPVRAKAFSKALGEALGRPSWLPVPGFALELALGEFADYALTGRRAVPAALIERGFAFSFPALKPALDDIVKG